jgi:hypothetical protein
MDLFKSCIVAHSEITFRLVGGETFRSTPQLAADQIVPALQRVQPVEAALRRHLAG